MDSLRTSWPDPAADRAAFVAWQCEQRGTLRGILGIPEGRVPLHAESRGTLTHDGIVIEKWVYTAEPGSRIPAVVYRPAKPARRMPALVLTYGHGGSKSHPCYQYLGQLYAKLGVAVLAADPVGEEERHVRGRRGTRAHDPEPVHCAARDAGRLIMGKLVFDTMRGIDFMLERDDIDDARIGVGGNSLGGSVAGWMAALDPRLRFAMVSGWAFGAALETHGKLCTRVPNVEMRKTMSWPEYLALAAPHCSMIILNGDADVIIDKQGNGDAWHQTQAAVDAVTGLYAALGNEGGIRTWLQPKGGHRPYPAHPDGVRWFMRRVMPSDRQIDGGKPLPGQNFGQWADAFEIRLEKLYGTNLHLRGATVVDRDIRPLAPGQLRVLRTDEAGTDEYTLKGWLKKIAESADR